MGRAESRFAARAPTSLKRPQLPDAEVERIRRERIEPRPTQWDYVHLNGLRRELGKILVNLPPSSEPVLDLFCGSKPYSALIEGRQVWGVDQDRHFGGADVLGTLPLPLRDGAFGVVLCTQALHLVDDPIATVREAARVLAPEGKVIITIPHLFLGEGHLERHWSRDDLRELFVDWRDVRILQIDGPGAALAFVVGRITMLAARKWRAMRLVYVPIVLVLNGAALLLDRLLTPLHRRFPHSLLLVARRPISTGVSSASPSDAGERQAEPS